MNWTPHTLVECVDSPALGWLTGLLACGMLIWYVIIARKWWESSRLASAATAKLWQWLVVIFIVCACAGYLSWILALWWPKIATLLRIAALAVQNVACPMFWHYAASQRFTAASANEHVGANVVEAAGGNMDDRELASFVRRLVKENLELRTRR